MLQRIKPFSELVNEILDHLPVYVWESNTTTFLDPAMGGGQFLVEVVRRLRAHGHSDRNIRNRVFGFESSKALVDLAINMNKLIGTFKKMSYEEFLEKDHKMKFDVVLGNPPYQGKAEMHQKFFNKSVDLLNDGGTVAFIQPATPYFNKKDSIRSNAEDMISNVSKYKTKISIVDGKIFENADIFTDLAITVTEKTLHNTGKIDSYTSKSGVVVKNISISAINKLDMDPVIYSSLVRKIKNKISTNGSLQDLVSKDTNKNKLYVQKVRGHVNNSDFYTFISSSSEYWTIEKEHAYGLLSSTKEKDSLISYLKSYVARFSLSIYKFNGNNHMGEFKSVSVVPFDRIWNDKMLCEYFDILLDEYNEILRCIPDYYGIGNNF
jgi:23S rRNA A1618 N6-methylase RlmF